MTSSCTWVMYVLVNVVIVQVMACHVYGAYGSITWTNVDLLPVGHFNEIWIKIQSIAAITWSDLTWYYVWHCDDRGRRLIRLEPHNKHPTPRPHGRVMGCLCEDFGENWPHYNGTTLYYNFHSRKWFSIYHHSPHSFSLNRWMIVRLQILRDSWLCCCRYWVEIMIVHPSLYLPIQYQCWHANLHPLNYLK